MRNQRKVHTLLLALSLAFATGLSSIASGQEALPFPPSAPPASTPPGIILVEVLREVSLSSDQYLWTRLGDANGRSVFYFAGASTNGEVSSLTNGEASSLTNGEASSLTNGEASSLTTGEASSLTNGEASADEFQPLLAAQDASAFDDWSLVRHQQSMQWAYQSQPLYTWSKEQDPGEIAINVALHGFGDTGGEFGARTVASDALMPPEGWQVARFTPAASIDLPDGIDLSLVLSGQGAVLTNFEGFSLYALDDNSGNPELSCTNKDCYEQWAPVAAPALAIGVGEFSIIERRDGTRQWTFQGKPLFRYQDDLLPGDVHGREAHEYLQLALLKENFRPEGVTVTAPPAYGDILTLNGMTLYTGSAFEKYWGGRNLRGSFQVAYSKGKNLGGNACVSSECLQSWRPFTAAADAKPSGFWELFTREDGSRQWAYKGFALYTHSYDEIPGHLRGHSLYDIADVDGDVEAFERSTMLSRVGGTAGGAAVYWSVAKP